MCGSTVWMCYQKNEICLAAYENKRWYVFENKNKIRTGYKKGNNATKRMMKKNQAIKIKLPLKMRFISELKFFYIKLRFKWFS